MFTLFRPIFRSITSNTRISIPVLIRITSNNFLTFILFRNKLISLSATDTLWSCFIIMRSFRACLTELGSLIPEKWCLTYYFLAFVWCDIENFTIWASLTFLHFDIIIISFTTKLTFLSSKTVVLREWACYIFAFEACVTIFSSKRTLCTNMAIFIIKKISWAWFTRFWLMIPETWIVAFDAVQICIVRSFSWTLTRITSLIINLISFTNSLAFSSHWIVWCICRTFLARFWC